MKKLLLSGIATLFLATGTAHARNSDWQSQIVGAGSEIACDQFNKFNKAKKDRALAWAFGYVSGMATSNVEEARLNHEHERFSKLLDLEIKESALRAAIERQCHERPSVYFPLIVEWVYAEWK
jgi:hypothetical protein